jgi:SAM-dependent methyltransferase
MGRYYAKFRDWIWTEYYERKFGVSTSGFIQARELGSDNPDSMDHSPLNYDYIYWGLRSIPFPVNDAVFLDYGSGKGRVLVAAAGMPFRKVMGVEISERLAAVARQNLAAMKHRRAAAFEVYQSDAAAFPFPDDVNVVFLFNPFVGQTLTEVVRRIEASCRAHPRELFVIAVNHREFDRRVRGATWIAKVYEAPLCALYRAPASIVLNE